MKFNRIMITACLAGVALQAAPADGEPSLSLVGELRFQLDENQIEAGARWYCRPLVDTIRLPATTARAIKVGQTHNNPS